ncbi:MAG: YppE family protein [Solibacillus sp.]
MQLKQQTQTLIEQCDLAVTRFHDMRARDAVPDFFGDVKPHADFVHGLLLHYRESAAQWIEIERPKYMRMPQIDNLIDAMEQFIVQSFYKETSKKRFLQSVQSVHYTLSSILRYLEEDGDAK